MGDILPISKKLFAKILYVFLRISLYDAHISTWENKSCNLVNFCWVREMEGCVFKEEKKVGEPI